MNRDVCRLRAAVPSAHRRHIRPWHRVTGVLFWCHRIKTPETEGNMATIRKLRGKWQAMVRRKGMPQRAKSFDKRADAERWARDLEGQIDRIGVLADTRAAENTTLRELLQRYLREITPGKA